MSAGLACFQRVPKRSKVHISETTEHSCVCFARTQVHMKAKVCIQAWTLTTQADSYLCMHAKRTNPHRDKSTRVHENGYAYSHDLEAIVTCRKKKKAQRHAHRSAGRLAQEHTRTETKTESGMATA